MHKEIMTDQVLDLVGSIISVNKIDYDSKRLVTQDEIKEMGLLAKNTIPDSEEIANTLIEIFNLIDVKAPYRIEDFKRVWFYCLMAKTGANPY